MRTSESHPLRIDEVSIPGVIGRIGLTFCPGKKGESFTGTDWDRSMEADLEVIRLWGAHRVLTLIEDFEFDLLGVRGLGELVAGKGMNWHHLPIVDGYPPDQRFLEAWPSVVNTLVEDLSAGKNLLVHCRGGLGRAGTVGSLLLAEFGWSSTAAVDHIRRARPGTVETREQELFIEGYVRWRRQRP